MNGLSSYSGRENVPAHAASLGPCSAQWAAQARELLVQGDARLLKRYGREVDIDRLLALRARMVDDILQRAWHDCMPADAPLSLQPGRLPVTVPRVIAGDGAPPPSCRDCTLDSDCAGNACVDGICQR